MGSKINTTYWGSNVSPTTSGGYTLSYGRSTNNIRTLIANGAYDPNTDSFDYSVSPWGIGYSAAGNRGQIVLLRNGSRDGAAPGVFTKIMFDGMDKENSNRPFALIDKNHYFRDSFRWLQSRVGGDITVDSQNYMKNAAVTYASEYLSQNSTSDGCLSLARVATYLDYQKYKLQIIGFSYINLDTGAISGYNFKNANETVEQAKTRFENFSFPEHMAIVCVRLSMVGYAAYSGSPTGWSNNPEIGQSGNGIQLRGHSIGSCINFNQITATADDETKFKLCFTWDLGVYNNAYASDDYASIPNRYWSTDTAAMCFPVEGMNYRTDGQPTFNRIQVNGLGFSTDDQYRNTNMAGNFCDKEQKFSDINYKQRPLLYRVVNSQLTEVKEGDAVVYNTYNYYRLTSIYEVSGSDTFTKAQILALIKHEVAFYGFEFYIGWGNATGGTFTVGSDDLYLPKFDEHLITTGMYTSGTASLSEPNASWGNVFDDTMPDYDVDYNPSPQPGPGGGGMTIGGSQTNYPNGLTGHNNGSVYNGTDGNSMYQGNSILRGAVENTIALSMSGKIYCIDSQMLNQAINALNNTSLIQAAARSTIQEIYGANVYDGITLCRMYPFNLEGSAYAQVPYIYGVYPLLELENGVPKPGQYYFWICNKYAYQFDMGYVIPPIEQAWEIENIEYSIYLPFAGTYPIDIRSSEIIRVYLNVDIFSGLGEYVVYQGAQLTHSFKVNLGWDIPINLSRGEMLQNLYTTTQNTIAKTIGVGSTALGIATGNPIAGMAGNMVAQGVANSEHWAVTAPQIGGIAGLFSYPKARLICKIPKMFNNAYGYNELLGANRSTGYVALNSCSGFVKCKNYKCDIIVATSDEKAEIERLMDTGVFV